MSGTYDFSDKLRHWIISFYDRERVATMKTLALRKTKTKLDFVPVIFANGTDDDLPGISAALRNERVQFEETIYDPGQGIAINRKYLALSCGCLIASGISIPTPPRGTYYKNTVCVDAPDDGRCLRITDCRITMNIGRAAE